MNAEVLAIGDEITSGRLLDTNSQWLSQRLEELGIRVHYHATVGDELQPMVAVFRQAFERANVIIATGGLGPTADDLTREAIAAAVNRSLVLDPAALEHVRALFARHHREMPRQNEIQAMFPAGSRVIPNPHGTAPGIDLDEPRPDRTASRVFALPGVPAEMREMWHGYVADALRQSGAGRRVICRRNLKCFGAGESQIESMLPDLIRRGRTPTVGINASGATIILRIAAEGATPQECEVLIEPTAAVIRQALGPLVFGEGDDELQDVVLRLLGQRQRTLATVEVGTAGLVADWLGSDPGAEQCYRGGLVAPSGAALSSLVGVGPGPATPDEQAAGEATQTWATACRERFAADFGLAVGPFPVTSADAGNPPPVFFALAGHDRVTLKKRPYAGHPALLRTLCAKYALNMVRLALGEH